MEKLLELLNEYRTEKGEKNLNESEVGQTLDSLNYLRLFIKWLVDNDKIDLEKVKNIKLPIDTKLRANVDKDEKTCFNMLYTLKLLMLLSIEDKPIEFLISVLK